MSQASVTKRRTKTARRIRAGAKAGHVPPLFLGENGVRARAPGRVASPLSGDRGLEDRVELAHVPQLARTERAREGEAGERRPHPKRVDEALLMEARHDVANVGAPRAHSAGDVFDGDDACARTRDRAENMGC